MSDVMGTGEDQQEAQGQPTEQSVEQLLQQLLTQQAEHRAEVNAMRQEIARQRVAPPPGPQPLKSAEQLHEERMADIRAHSHYCPGCGALSTYMKECRGTGASPHPPIDMVNTEELLSDDPSQHTPAPATTNLG